MSQHSDATVKRTMTYLFSGLFGFFLVLIALAHTIAY